MLRVAQGSVTREILRSQNVKHAVNASNLQIQPQFAGLSSSQALGLKSLLLFGANHPPKVTYHPVKTINDPILGNIEVDWGLILDPLGIRDFGIIARPVL